MVYRGDKGRRFSALPKPSKSVMQSMPAFFAARTSGVSSPIMIAFLGAIPVWRRISKIPAGLGLRSGVVSPQR